MKVGGSIVSLNNASTATERYAQRGAGHEKSGEGGFRPSLHINQYYLNSAGVASEVPKIFESPLDLIALVIIPVGSLPLATLPFDIPHLPVFDW